MKDNLHKSEEALKNSFEKMEVPFEQEAFGQFKDLLDANVQAPKSFWQRFSMNGLIVSVVGLVLISVLTFNIISDDGPTINSNGTISVEDLNLSSNANDVMIAQANEKVDKGQDVKEQTVNTITRESNANNSDNAKVSSSVVATSTSNALGQKEVLAANSSNSNSLGNNPSDQFNGTSELKTTSASEYNSSSSGIVSLQSRLSGTGDLQSGVIAQEPVKAFNENASTAGLLNRSEGQISKATNAGNSKIKVADQREKVMAFENLGQIGLSTMSLNDALRPKHNPGMIRVMQKEDYYESHFYAEVELGNYNDENFAGLDEFLELVQPIGGHFRIIGGYQFNKNIALELAYQYKDEELKWGLKSNSFDAIHSSSVNLFSLRLKNRLYVIQDKLSINAAAGLGLALGANFNNFQDWTSDNEPLGLDNLTYQYEWSRSNGKTALLLDSSIGLSYEFNRKWSLGVNAGFVFGQQRLSQINIDYLVNEGIEGDFEAFSNGSFEHINLSLKYHFRN